MTFQTKIAAWMENTFHYQTNSEAEAEAKSTQTRLLRFLEEAVELCQAEGMSKHLAVRVLDYVYDRPAGQPNQEIGGVMVTLTAYCVYARPIGYDLMTEAWREFYRIDTPEMRDKIRNKQLTKPNGLLAPEEIPNYRCGKCGAGYDHMLDRDFHQNKCDGNPF